MAFPTIPTAAAGRVLTGYQADTTGTRTFPSLTGLTKNAGDLLIAICIAYQSSTTDAQFSGWGASFTEFHDSGTGTTMAIGAAYKWSDGTETGTFAVTQAATITGHACFILLSIPGAHGTSVPEAGSRASGTSAAADPGSFDPSWAAEDILWIAVGGAGEVSTTAAWTGLATAPTDYGDYAETGLGGQDTAGAVEGAVAFRQLNATSTDVGTFGVDVANARNAAVVIAVRPAPVTSANAEEIPITATSQQPAAEIGPNAEAATAVGTGNDATVEIGGGGTNAPAEAAEATATAETASVSVDPNAEAVTLTATAEQPAVSIDVNAEAATAVGISNDAGVEIGPNTEAASAVATGNDTATFVDVNAEAAAAVGTGNDATVEASGGATNANAECATAVATAEVAGTEIGANAEASAATTVGNDTSVALEVLAEAVAIVAAAYAAVITGGDEPDGWSTPYASSTRSPVYTGSTPSATYAASTARGVL